MARKAKQSVTADEILKQMYPDLPTSDDAAPPPVAKDPVAEAADKQIAELRQQIAGLQSTIASTSRANATLQSQQIVQAGPQRPVIDYTQAPDPLDDKVGYTKFMADAQQKLIDYEKEKILFEQRQMGAQQQKLQTLWGEFSEAHGDYAKDDKRLVIATQQVIARAQAKGVDAERYMYGNSAQFMQDVVAEYDGLFGKPGGAAAEDGDGEDDDDTSLETLGGSVGGKSGAQQKQAPQPERYGSLSKEVMAWQEKTGFHR